jgi:hypothetical protein
MPDQVRDATFEAFMTTYDPHGTRVMTDITPIRDADGNSPFVIVRHGRYTAVLTLMPFSSGDSHLCIDVHAFADGQDATSAPFGITDGSRVTLPGTGRTSHGFPALHITSVLIGEQGTRPQTQRLTVAIPLTDVMRTPEDLADALRQVASKVQSGTGTGKVRDKMNNFAGEFDITSEPS